MVRHHAHLPSPDPGFVAAGTFSNGIGLGQCYVALIKGTSAWWASEYPGFCSGYIMAITSSGSFVFAWINHLLNTHFQLDHDPAHGPAYGLIYTGLVVFCCQLIGSLLLCEPKSTKSPVQSGSSILETRQILSTWQFWALVVIWFSNLVPMLGMVSVLADTLHDPMQFNQTTATSASLLALINASGVAFRLVVGILVEQIGTRPFFTAALGGQIIIFSVMPSTALDSESLGIFISLLCLSKICYGAGFTLTNVLARDIFGAQNGTQVFSLCISAFALAAVCSPSIISSVSLCTYCYISSGVASIGLVLLHLIRPYGLCNVSSDIEGCQEHMITPDLGAK